ncbi:MAG: class I SAM-dependent methyltransferase [Phycisphaerae bacterium]
MTPVVVDVRPEMAFLAAHRAAALPLPLEELATRTHELPPAGTPIVVYDDDPQRAAAAAERLSASGRWSVSVAAGSAWLAGGPIERGPASVRYWQPHRLLVEALPRIGAAWGGLARRTALDVACGSGRDAVFMALSGLHVTAVDILPDAIARATDLARRSGVALDARVADAVACDLLRPDAYDLVTVFYFLDRDLLAALRGAVRPGGFLVYDTFLEAQRELHGKPSRSAHLLKPGELRAAFADWRLEIDREGEQTPGRITASVVARRPAERRP